MMAVPGELYRSLDAAYEELKLKYAALKTKVDSLRSAQLRQPATCAHFMQFDDCVFFLGDMSCGREACPLCPRRQQAENELRATAKG